MLSFAAKDFQETSSSEEAGKFYSMRLPHQTWLPPITTCLHRTLHVLAEQRFDSYKDMKKWLDEWFAPNGKDFYWRGIHKLPEGWENVQQAMEHTLKKALFIILLNLKCFLETNPHFIHVHEMTIKVYTR